MNMAWSKRCLTCMKGFCGSTNTLPLTEESRALTYREVHALGHGATGEVTLVIEERTGDPLTCKSISISRQHKAEREIVILRKLKGSHLPCFHDVKRTSDNIQILTEYIPGVDLYAWYECTPEKERKMAVPGLVKQMLICLQELAEDGFVHLDVKPENFVLSEDGKLTLIDLGCAHPFHSLQKRRLRSSAGTAGYSPPEIHMGYYHRKTDMWSLGVCVWTLYFGERPFPEAKGKDITSTTFLFPTEYHEERLEDVSGAMGDFVRGCILFRPGKRMSLNRALSHAWIE